MKKWTKLSKYSPLIFLLIPLLFILCDWYQKLMFIEYNVLNEKGFSVLFDEHGRIAIIYLLCILIQTMAFKSKQFLFPVVAEIIFILALTFYPANHFPIQYTGAYFLSALYIGYFVAVISILISIVLNVIKFIRKNVSDI